MIHGDQSLLDVFAREDKNLHFYTKDRHKYYHATGFGELYKSAQKLALYLKDNGISKGDKVAVFSDNRMEWIIVDMAIQLAGGVVVPRGTDSTEGEIEYIIEHSESKIIFLENLRVYKKIAAISNAALLPKLVLDTGFPPDILSKNSLISLQALLESLPEAESRFNELQAIRQTITGKDLFTIIYTSGTTGNPKGVMLSHANMLYQIKVVPPVLGINSKDRILSILPIWHIFERFMEYCVIASGADLYYTNTKDLMEDFIRVKPTLMASAPRLWETIYQKLHERIEKTEALNRELFDISYSVKRNLRQAENQLAGNVLESEPKSFIEKIASSILSLGKIAAYKLPDLYLDPIFLMRVRAMLGGELRGTISGGGALPLHIDQFFNAIGIPVYEGYGMTECSPLISMRVRGKVIEGTVGFAPDQTEVKLVKEDGSLAKNGEQGVIHVRGPGVMQGYYKNQEATDATLRDGWLNTGDIGVWSVNGALAIRGRAKDTIVLLGGENIEPVPIEIMLTQHKMIEQAVVVGQDKKHLGVLIWPDYEKLEDAGFEVNEFDIEDDLNQRPQLIKMFSEIVHEIVNEKNGFKNFERISSVRFLPDKLRLGETLTNLQKVKRNVVLQKYNNLIESMFKH
ncbi:MAG: AMP-binding protein [Leptospiraceae bacterium]|nr:AMP-binding protein [Leptospiraceae bacterium]